MGNKDHLLEYKHAEVAKIFPLYGTVPFKGTVKAVDTRGKDDAPFRVVYEDGDSEWIGLEELKSILVKVSSKAEAPKSDKKRARSNKQAPAEPQPAAAKDAAAAAAAADQQEGKSKKQRHGGTSQQQQQRADAAAAAADAAREALKAAKAAAKKAPAAAAAAGDAAAAGAGGQGEAGVTAGQAKQQRKSQQQQQGVSGGISFTVAAGAARAAADKAAAGTSKDTAAAAAAGKDAAAAASGKAAAASGKAAAASGKASKPSKTAAAAPTAAAAAPAGTPGKKGAPGKAAGGAASVSDADTQGMLAAIHQAAAPTADKLAHDRQVARMPYQGAGAAVLPAMSQVVLAGGCCYVTLHSAPRAPRNSTPGKGLSQQPSSSAGAAAAAIEYEGESAALLAELQRLLAHANTDKRWLIKVRVTLRSMQDGLPGFQAAWNAWAARNELPVMTLVEGAGPFKAAGVMLEATALAAP